MRARSKQRARANPEANKQWRVANPERTNEIRRKSYARHKTEREARRKQARDRLDTFYVKQVLRKQGIPLHLIPPALVEAERAMILLKRELRKTR